MKPYLPFFIFIFTFSSIYAQQSGFGTVFPPSPEASALAKYANIPVNHYTGIPDINVPIFTLKGQDFQLPVGLRYHAQGVKVNDISGSTGMGWSIDGAGVITRVVRDEPDEEGYCSEGNGTDNLVNDPDTQDYVRIAQSYDYYGFNDYVDVDPENTTINPGGPPIVHEPSGQPFTSYTYQGWKRGLIKSKIQKNNLGNEVFKETYEYHFNYALAADINAIKALLVGDVDGDPVLSVGTYRMISQPYFIKKYTSINNNSLTLIKEFKTNTKNYQVHQEIVNNGIEKTITKFKYPVDYLGVAICNEMVTYKNMIANMIEKQIWKTDLNDQNKRIVDGVLMNYWLVHNHIVPLDIYEFQASTSVNEVDFGENLNDDNFLSLNTDIEFYKKKKELKYNEFGLITEEKLNDGVPLSYVYGYNNNLPVAKIEGANITTVDNLLSSYNGINNLSQQEKSDLRNIPNTLVSFYTYDPLKGMTSETGPDNIKLTYEYDDFGRLKLVKDHNGDILKRYTYQYRVQ